MPEGIGIAQFERRLVELGYPPRSLRARLRELTEHHDDLKQAALEDGLSEREAENRADAQLGDPVFLAESAAALLRQSSWWGRHPILGFGLMPLLVFFLAWAGCLGCLAGLCWLLGQVFGPAFQFDQSSFIALSEEPALFYHFVRPANAAVASATILLVVVVFQWLARRAAIGWKWTLVNCGVCSLIGLFIHAGLEPRSVVVACGWPPPPRHWLQAAIPLLAAAAAYVGQRRKEQRLSWVPLKRQRGGPESPPAFRRPPAVLRFTPTSWVMAVLTATLLAGVARYLIVWLPERAYQDELKSRIWPAERAATLARLKAGHPARGADSERRINLKPFVNVALTNWAGQVKDNSLAELAAGIHTLGGVDFDIEGSIHLAGDEQDRSEKGFPTRIRIPLAGRCARFHVLHGSRNLHAAGQEIARLVLRHADGSSSRFGIVGGRQALNWWGPIYHTEAGDARYPLCPNTELAWVGRNPGIQRSAPEKSLRLYKTTFVNPHPELAVVGVDYVSLLQGPASFLVGLTLEQPTPVSNYP